MKRLEQLILVLIIFSTGVSASELPKSMIEALNTSKQAFVTYSAKTPDQIYDHQYDESDFVVLFKLDYAENMGFVMPKEIMREYRFQLIKNAAEVFSLNQLIALESMSKELTEMSGGKSESRGKYFEVAGRWKNNKLSESKARKILSSKPFSKSNR